MTELNPSRQARARYITVFATFLAFMGIGVVDPILPVIAKSIGATGSQVEMLFTAYIFTMAIMMIPSGIFASRFGDKKMMIIGLGLVTIFALMCGLSNGIPELSAFRAGWGLGNSMFFATTMTLLIALSPDAGRAVGNYEAAIGLGMAGGPLVGGLLGGYSWRLPFIATAILIFLAFLCVILFVYDPSKGQKRQAAGLRDLIKLISYWPFLQGALAGMLYYYGFFVVLAYTPLVLSQLSAIQIGLVFFFWGLMMAYGSAVLSHQLEKKYTPKALLPFAMLAFFVFVGLLFFVTNLWGEIILIVLSGLTSGLNNALFTSYVMEVSPYQRSITSGSYNFVRWMGAALAPLLSGLIGEAISPRAPFGVAALLVIIGIVLISLRTKHKAAHA
jgi:MFS transporter, ACDE family, multidrug resistance protein